MDAHRCTPCFSGEKQLELPDTTLVPRRSLISWLTRREFLTRDAPPTTMQCLPRQRARSTPRTTTSWQAIAAASSSSQRERGGAGATTACAYFVNLHDSGPSQSRLSSDGPWSSLSSGGGGACCPWRSTIRLRRRWTPPWMWRKAYSRSQTRSTSGRGTPHTPVCWAAPHRG